MQQEKKIAKKRGRPATGTGRTVGVRIRDELSSQIEGWRSRQRPIPSEPEAIRRLVELALAADQPTRRTSSKTAARAAELAGKTIDRNSDPTATPEERTARKRRILKGPSMERGEK